MEKLHYSISIDTSKEKVWQTLWDETTYEKWTVPFCEGSKAVTDWKEGSKVLFLGNTGEGMVSVIEEKRPNEYMAFKHLGMIKDGVEDTESDAVKPWAGVMETYTLSGENGQTNLVVEMDVPEENLEYFNDAWPKALEVLKQLSESSTRTPKVTPFLWFNNNVEEAMNFYTTVFKDARVTNVMRNGAGGPGPEGSVMSATIHLNGLEFIAFNGGPMYSFTPALSMFITCETQEEIDEFWDKLSEGGIPNRCGWLQDKFGLSWQVVPAILGKLIQDKNPVKSKNVVNAMLQMVKLDIQKLKDAYEEE